MFMFDYCCVLIFVLDVVLVWLDILFDVIDFLLKEVIKKEVSLSFYF